MSKTTCMCQFERVHVLVTPWAWRCLCLFLGFREEATGRSWRSESLFAVTILLGPRLQCPLKLVVHVATFILKDGGELEGYAPL